MKRFRLLPVSLGFVGWSVAAASLWGVGLGIYAVTESYNWLVVIASYLCIGGMFWALRSLRREVRQRKAEGCWEVCPHVQG